MKLLSIDNLKQLESIMAMMLSAAEKQEWEQLTALDGQRRLLLEIDANTAQELTPSSARVNPSLEYRALCERVLRLDKKILEAVESARQNLVEENRAIKNQVKAKKGYAKANSMKATSYG